MKKIYIEGMSCNHCVNHVKNALCELEGAEAIEVNLEGKYALVDKIEDNALIKEVIEEAGYDVVKIEAI